MKSIVRFAFLVLLVMTITLTVSSQDDKNNSGNKLFGKGSWLLEFNQPFRFSAYSDNLGTTVNRYSDFNLSFGKGYFFRDKMGIELNFDFERSMSDTYSKDIVNSTMFWGSYLQGFNIGGINLLGKAGIGLGMSREKDKVANIDDKSNLLKFKIEAGPVFQLTKNQSFLLYPSVGFMYGMEKFPGYRDISANFILKADLIFNIDYGQFESELKDNLSTTGVRYAKGVNSLNAFTDIDFKFGSLADKYTGAISYTGKYATNSQSLNLNYRYFIFDRFGVGAWVDLSSQSLNQKGSSTPNNVTNSNLLIGPGVTLFLPIGVKALDNFYIDFNAGIGSDTRKFSGGTNNENIIGGMVRLGYDLSISKTLSIDPAIGYNYYYFRNDETESHHMEHGPGFSIGLRSIF